MWNDLIVKSDSNDMDDKGDYFAYNSTHLDTHVSMKYLVLWAYNTHCPEAKAIKISIN